MNTHMTGFQSFFRFLHHFVLAKLATSSIRVTTTPPIGYQNRQAVRGVIVPACVCLSIIMLPLIHKMGICHGLAPKCEVVGSSLHWIISGLAWSL